MRYKPVSALVAGTLLALAGCGPVGPKPMPDRLSDQDQKAVTDAWDQVLQTPDQVDKQSLLDALLLTQAYQNGVDRLTFRSEKDFSGGTVVMAIHFDRAKPADDRFEVWVRDKAGKEVRHFAYTRAEVETTFADLSNPKYAGDRDSNDPPLPPEEARKREEVRKRVAAVEKVFPKPPEAKGAK